MHVICFEQSKYLSSEDWKKIYTTVLELQNVKQIETLIISVKLGEIRWNNFWLCVFFEANYSVNVSYFPSMSKHLDILHERTNKVKTKWRGENFCRWSRTKILPVNKIL